MQYLVLGTAIIHFLVAFYVILHKPRTKAKIFFTLAEVQLGVWTLVHYFGQYMFEGIETLLLWMARISLISVLFFPSTYALFFSRIVTEKKDLFYKFVNVSFLAPLCMLPFSFGDLNARGFYADTISYEYIEIGALYGYYIPYFLIALKCSFVPYPEFFSQR